MIFKRIKALKAENDRLRLQLVKALRRANIETLNYVGLSNEVKNHLDPCRICDHKSCAECRSNQQFKWRGEKPEDD